MELVNERVYDQRYVQSGWIDRNGLSAEQVYIDDVEVVNTNASVPLYYDNTSGVTSSGTYYFRNGSGIEWGGLSPNLGWQFDSSGNLRVTVKEEVDNTKDELKPSPEIEEFLDELESEI